MELRWTTKRVMRRLLEHDSAYHISDPRRQGGESV